MAQVETRARATQAIRRREKEALKRLQDENVDFCCSGSRTLKVT